jgi:hypothetical protein
MSDPRIIPVGAELPPMNDAPRQVAACRDRGKRKGTAADGKRRAGDRFHTFNAFVDVTMADLRPAERSVWLILFRDTGPDGLARTSQADLARRAGVTQRGVRKALCVLERRGLVSVVQRGRLLSGPSCYRVRALAADRS